MAASNQKAKQRVGENSVACDARLVNRKDGVNLCPSTNEMVGGCRTMALFGSTLLVLDGLIALCTSALKRVAGDVGAGGGVLQFRTLLQMSIASGVEGAGKIRPADRRRAGAGGALGRSRRHWPHSGSIGHRQLRLRHRHHQGQRRIVRRASRKVSKGATTTPSRGRVPQAGRG